MMCVFWELCPHPEVGDPALSLTDRGHWQGPKAPKIFVCIAVAIMWPLESSPVLSCELE